ncbi:hypothetical protein [Streptomyces sp. NPDC047841]|uniref:hypothetical protein n=1 Tax=Streptomyces sp. NPDC047841 TaxID=3154708 RepID=UPI003451F224
MALLVELGEQPSITQVVVRMTVEGYVDTEIADALDITHAAVRMRKTRFRGVLYESARERRIWIPDQLHTKAGARHGKQRVPRDRATARGSDARAGHVHPLLRTRRPHRVRNRPPGQGPGEPGDRWGSIAAFSVMTLCIAVPAIVVPLMR